MSSPSEKIRLLVEEITTGLAEVRPKALSKYLDDRHRSELEFDEDWRASVRALLDSRQITLRGLALALGCSAPYLGDMLSGARNVQKWAIKRLPREGRALLAGRLLREEPVAAKMSQPSSDET